MSSTDFPDYQPNPIVITGCEAVVCNGAVVTELLPAPGAGHHYVIAALVFSPIGLNTEMIFHIRPLGGGADFLTAYFLNYTTQPIDMHQLNLPNNMGLECFAETAAAFVTVMYGTQ